MYKSLIAALTIALATASTGWAQNINLPPLPHAWVNPTIGAGVAATDGTLLAQQTQTTSITQGTAAQGAAGTTNSATQGNWYGQSQATAQQNAATLTTSSGMPTPGTFTAPGSIAGMVWGGSTLPTTNLDSFVSQSGYDNDIYGDEGVTGPPPLSGFEQENTIGQGISESADSSTLTTGHASTLPSAWLWTTLP